MYLSDAVEKGAIAIIKEGPEYVIKFKGYTPHKSFGQIIFKHENLHIAYMKLEEFLSIEFPSTGF